MHIIKKNLYKIDAKNNECIKNILPNNTAADQLITNQIQKVQNNTDLYIPHQLGSVKISFVITQTDALISAINSSSGKDINIDYYFDNIAQKLLDAEKIGDRSIQQMGKNVITGTILIALVFEGSQYSFIVIKFEHKGIYDYMDQFKLHTGIPDAYKDLELKISYWDYTRDSDEECYTLDSIYISEKKKSAYWAKNFMEVIPLSTSEQSTAKAISSLNTAFNRIKRKCPDDYPVLQSNYISYLSSNEVFQFDDFCSTVFDKYTNTHPDSKFKADSYKSFIRDKITNNKMQGEFRIAPDIVSNKLINKTIKLNTYFKLKRINLDSIDNRSNSNELNEDIICLIKGNSNDDYYLKIAVDSNYDNLNKLKEYDFHHIIPPTN